MIQKKLLLATALLLNSICNAQSIGIGTATPNASAQLDVASTTKGLLIPRMTSAQRNNIANPAKGLLVFDSTTSNLSLYSGSVWRQMLSASNVRFGFDLAHPSSLATSYNLNIANNYNLDPTSVSLVNATTFQIQRQGIYQFSVLGYTHNGLAASAIAYSAIFNLKMTVGTKVYQIIGNGAMTGQSSSWSYGCTAFSFELFVPANSLITFNAITSLNSGFFKSDNGHFLGYLISE